jgi:hypothetical protein
LLDILAQHSARWETVRLFGPLYMFIGLACIRGNLPLLCKLQVLCHPPDPDDGCPVDVFKFAPNLRDVTVNMEDFHEDPVRILLPFPGLQQYAARDTLDSHLHTLASASNLVECAGCRRFFRYICAANQVGRVTASPSPLLAGFKTVGLFGYASARGAVLLQPIEPSIIPL